MRDVYGIHDFVPDYRKYKSAEEFARAAANPKGVIGGPAPVLGQISGQMCMHTAGMAGWPEFPPSSIEDWQMIQSWIAAGEKYARSTSAEQEGSTMSVWMIVALVAAGALTTTLIRKHLPAWEWLMCAVCMIITAASAVLDCLAIDTRGAVFESLLTLALAWGLRSSWPRRHRRNRRA